MDLFRIKLIKSLQRHHTDCLALPVRNYKWKNPTDMLSRTGSISQRGGRLQLCLSRSFPHELKSNYSLPSSFSLKALAVPWRSLHTTLSLNKVVQFNLADIGEGIREVTIKEWNPDVRVGTKIAEFDVLCEVESDKASVSITSRYSGVVTKVYHVEGEVAQVGKPLIEIEIDGEEERPNPIETPSGEVSGGNNNVNIASDETNTYSDKTEVITGTNESKQILENNQEDSVVQSNQHGHFVSQPVVLNKNRWKILATPAVRRMIKQYNIDTKHLRGTGKQGRVLKDDIVTYMNSPAIDHSCVGQVQTLEHLGTANKSSSVIPIKGYVKAMFKSMSESNAIPTLRLTEEVDTSRLKEVKAELSQIYREKFNAKVTYMPFFIKALSQCIAEYPILNASIDDTSQNIIINAQHNICIAIDTEHGLVVPNIKDVNKLSLGDIAHELNRLMASAREGKVSPADLQGGTIAMSNLGNVGGSLAQPIIMPRQVSIVAMGRMQLLPRYDANGSLVPRSMLNVTWAADHRVVDGASTARAATMWKSLIENPLLLLAS